MLYPNKIKKDCKNNISHANRGMDLEYLINEANKYYLINDVAIIYKKPTPIQINKVNFASGTPIVTKAKFKEKSTLDYVGLYKGKYIDFDAKKTLNKTCFPLENIHAHQLEHIKRIINHGGIAFLLIEMNGFVYLLTGEKLLEFILNNERRSIPYTFIKENGHSINYSINPTIDYLKIIDKIYFKDEKEKK